MEHLGYSVYISTFSQQKAFLEQLETRDFYIFTSLHIVEEQGKQYKEQAENMFKWLNNQGFKVIADISKRTLDFFSEKDIVKLARRLGIAILRIDYGFSDEEIIELAKDFPIAFNASTVPLPLVRKLKQVAPQILAIHNYYPRAYTGLSRRQFEVMNQKLEKEGIEVVAFIPNSGKSRGPIYEGLPTLEHERYESVVVNYFEMKLDLKVPHILLADLGIEPLEEQIIREYQNSKVICIPCLLEKRFDYLYNQIFTIRIDSPDCAYRLQESREFATAGNRVQPFNCQDRCIGCITCDNLNYGRYSGEIQIIREELPKDKRVNVIGQINQSYLRLTKFIPNGYQIQLIKGEG